MSFRKIVAILVLAAVAGGGVYAYQARPWQDSGPGAGGSALTLYGNIDIREVELAFKISERVEAMHAREGQRVAAGELVGELETTGVDLAVQRAEAQVAAQQAVVDELEAGTRQQEIRKARADVAAAEAELADARRTARRFAGLAEKELLSHEEADRAAARVDTAEARLRAVREALNLALAGPREQAIRAARAQLRRLETELELARYAQDQATLHAPVDGVIRDRILEPGDMAASDRPAYTLAQTNPVWARVYVPQPDLGRVEPGRVAKVKTDSFPDKTYRGWVGYISPTAEFTPKTVQTPRVRADLVYQVRVNVCNPQGELRLGMPTTVVIPTGEDARHVDDTPCPGNASEMVSNATP